METYHGHVRTPADAIVLFEACRIGLLPRVQRRLSEKERQSIKSGSVFVWDEREAGMRRWTDGKSWSASRVSGSFLTYREMEGKRGGNNFDKNANRDGMQNNEPDSDGGPDGYRYKPDGLMKQSFSITTNNGQHLHLISYYSRSSATSQTLMQPSSDPQLRHIRPEKGMYPESTVHEQSTIPAVTRGPMSSPGYTHSPHQPGGHYGRPALYSYPHPSWAPPSPMHTPPPHHYSPYYQPHGAHPGAYNGPPPSMQYPPHTQYAPHPPVTAFDRPPPHLSNTQLPPPPPHQYPPMPPIQPNGYGHGHPHPPPPYPPYQHGYPGYHPQQGQGPPPPYPPHGQQAPPYTLPPAGQLAAPPSSNPSKDERPEVKQPQPTQGPLLPPPKTSTTPPRSSEQQAQAGAPASAPPSLPPPAKTGPLPSSGQTIPSISAMLNGGEGGTPPLRSNSRSPNGTLRVPSDIPSHKLGFEANRDMQALRTLDKTTFKAY